MDLTGQPLPPEECMPEPVITSVSDPYDAPSVDPVHDFPIDPLQIGSLPRVRALEE